MQTGIALCAAISIGTGDAAAPEWLHLLPAGVVRTQDGRGPYRIADPAALMAASMAGGGRLVLDENHSTDLVAPKGGPAPARAWIVELQNRADGIWGRVDWVDAAGGTPVWKQYRGVSPVIAHDKNGAISAILRASLTNTPNLAGLVTLHSTENDMDLRAKLIEAMGLDSDASDEAIIAACKAMMKDSSDDAAAAMQSALAPIAQAAGLATGANAAAVLAGVRQLKAGAGDNAAIVALQSELTTTAERLNALTDTTTRKDATTFVDSAIAAGRVGVKPMRDRYIAMHMKDAVGTEQLINAMPAVKGGAMIAGDPPSGSDGLGAADASVIALMGLDPKAYAATHAQQKTEAL